MMSHTVVDDSRDRILDAACDLISANGPAAANVSAIANAAEVSRMTIYRKFTDRRALLAELFNRELGAIVTQAMTAPAPDQRHLIVIGVTESVRRINAHPLMEAVLRHEPELLTVWITDRLGATQRLAREVLRGHILAGQAGSGDGSVRDGDADEMALTLVLLAQTFVFSHQIGGRPAELSRLIEGYLK